MNKVVNVIVHGRTDVWEDLASYLPSKDVVFIFSSEPKEAEFHVFMHTSTGTGSPDPSWLPIVTSVSSQTLTRNKNYTISGQQLSGLTQGQQWGDEWEAATNYPLVRIVNNATHHVSYASVFDISSTSIAPKAPSTLSFTLASNIEKGPSKLYVVATGLASTGTPVVVN